MVHSQHYVLGTSMLPPYPMHTQIIVLGMGCFWGAEKRFWQMPGVYTTMVGYSGGTTSKPSYREVCSGNTGHCEVVRIVYHPQQLSLLDILKAFWQGHDPTQGMRQGNDHGSQYRSAVYVSDDVQYEQTIQSQACYQKQLTRHARGTITTEVLAHQVFYYAEEYHQQYLAKNPDGYCGHGGTGIAYDS